jgi:hypothetical protein
MFLFHGNLLRTVCKYGPFGAYINGGPKQKKGCSELFLVTPRPPPRPWVRGAGCRYERHHANLTPGIFVPMFFPQWVAPKKDFERLEN